jgi:hypothetical protein
MIPPHARSLDRPVPRPTPERPVTLDLGRWQLLLEARAGAIHAVWHDGETVSRLILGVPADGRLELRTRPPDHPLVVAIATPLSLLPGGRIRGFLRLPVQFQLVFLGPDGAVRVQTFQDRGLRLAWDDGPGGGEYTHPWTSELHGTPGGTSGDHGSLWAPVRILHRGFGLVTVKSLRMAVRAEELREDRGRPTVVPRRFVIGLDGKCEELVRGAGRRAEAPGERARSREGMERP